MAFAGHARSLDLSYTDIGHAFIGNVHPDRQHIISDQSPPQRPISGPRSRVKRYSIQQENSKELYGHDHGDDPLISSKIPTRHKDHPFKDSKGRSATSTLWVGNLPDGLTNNELSKAFEKYGNIVSVRAAAGKNCGFVNYEHIESAIQAFDACDMKCIFGKNPAWIRYEPTPPWVMDKLPSLKRKRSSANSLTSLPDDSVKRPIPIGPRSQVSQSMAPSGPKSQQTSISPPPLRRHDMYRPNALDEEDRIPPRGASERSRHNDLYRPSYDDDDEIVHSDRRTSTHNRSDTSLRDRLHSQGSPMSNGQHANGISVRSPSPSASSFHSSTRENAASSWGIGIKGLAASRKESLGDGRRSGLSIKGAAAQNRTVIESTAGISPPQRTTISRKSLPNGTASCLVNQTTQKRRSPSPRLAQIEPEPSLEGKPIASAVTPKDSSASVGRNVSRDALASTKESKSVSDGTHLEDATKQDQPSAMAKEMSGFMHLDHLYDFKEKEDSIAKKARTISPFSRLRASSRDTPSVKSAKTDPTPMRKLILDVCDTCKQVGSGFLELLECSVPSCFKKFHILCGNSLRSFDSTASGQETKLVCDGCLKDHRKSSKKLSLGPAMEQFFSRNDESMASVNAGNSTSPRHNNREEFRDKTITYSVVSIDSVTNTVDGIAGGKAHRHDCFQLPSKKTSQAIEKISERELSSSATTTNHVDIAKIANAQDSTTSLPIQLTNLPPTEPRLMRESDVDEKALEVSVRYKKTVTCPWWNKGDKCVRLEKDCMFAHRWTGIESPNGHLVAKEWTCYDYHNLLSCRYSEEKCLYSHRDTGLYVGVDGKASKKHLECYWWRYNGRCTFSDTSCTCAHYRTGLVAEEPMPRDTVRRAPHQPSIVSLQDVGSHVRSEARSSSRSSSYSPPPPPTVTTDSLFATQWPLQCSPEEVTSSILNTLDERAPRFDSGHAAEAGSDPRLKWNIELRQSCLRGGSVQNTPSDPNQEACFDGACSPRLDDQNPSQQSTQSLMNPCKNCGKKIFRAELCKDCQSLSQQRGSEHANATEQSQDLTIDEITLPITNQAMDQRMMNGSPNEHTPKAPVFAVPATRVLKRSRTNSSSNLFASKRMRPEMNIRSTPGQSPTMTNGVKKKDPPTLEQLNRANAKKRAQETAQTVDGSGRPSIGASIDRDDIVTPVAPSFSPFTILETPNETLRQTPVLNKHIPQSNRPRSLSNVDSSTIKVSYGTYDEQNPTPSRTETPANDSDSDQPLAKLRGEKEQYWSPNTSTQSIQETRNAPKATKKGIASVLSAQVAPVAPVLRCEACAKKRRKCVHDSDTGELDPRKCYVWQTDRNRQNNGRKAHYSAIQIERIVNLANQYAVNQNGSHESAEPVAKDDTTVVSEEEDASSSSGDELHKPDKRPAKTTAANTRLPRPRAETAVEAQIKSPTPQARRSAPRESLLGVKEAAHDVQTAELSDEQERADIICRLRAKGAVFEEDSDDDMDDDYEDEASMDKRVDPLLYHKQKNAVETSHIELPKITKGQGLKKSHLITKRQMQRNLQIFGDRHKEVDRQIRHQEVTAIVEKRDPDDILALPKEFEDQITFQEFLGIPKDKEIESCLGKVSLPRGKFIQGLAFKEKEIDPGLGAWGRERRGIRKEKPVYVVGL